jgi:NDP-sugar pyrophosphorylase family protein
MHPAQGGAMLDLPVVVLCGGLGTRLRPAVADRPKALARIGRTSFLTLQLELRRDSGARHFVLCVGHMAEQIEAEFGDGSRLGVRIDYSRDGEKLLGTGGALKRAERFFAPAAVVVNGDTYIDVDLEHLARAHANARERGAVATLTLTEMLHADRYGTVSLDANGWVSDFHEKDRTNSGWVNAGVYVIERELLDRVPAGEPASLERDVFPDALADGLTLAAFAHDGPFHDIGTPEALLAFARERETNNAA